MSESSIIPKGDTCCAPEADHSRARKGVDGAGMVASGLCAVHCLTVAFLPGLLTALGAGFEIGHEAEWALSLIHI